MKWIKCSERLPQMNSDDPIIFRKNWNYATAKAMIPVSVAAIMGIFNDKLNHIEWLDESDDSDLRDAFNAGRKLTWKNSEPYFDHNGKKKHQRGHRYKDYDDYVAQSLKKQ